MHLHRFVHTWQAHTHTFTCRVTSVSVCEPEQGSAHRVFCRPTPVINPVAWGIDSFIPEKSSRLKRKEIHEQCVLPMLPGVCHHSGDINSILMLCPPR